MKKALFTAIAFLASVTAGMAWDRADMNAHIDQTNFVVNTGCSGTLIDLQNRYVLTAAHCVGDQYETVSKEEINEDGTVSTKRVRRLKPGTVKQIFFDGASEVRETTYRTRLVGVDRDKDLALLQVLAPLPNIRAATLACTDPDRGETVYVVGNPMGSLYSSVVKGMVSSVQRDYGLLGVPGSEAEPLTQISGGIVGGNSGGSVYNEAGQLVGVPVLGHRVNEVLGFAVPLHVVRGFLAEVVKDGSKNAFTSGCISGG